MISILIPTYNYTCLELVKQLYRQGKSLGQPFEVIVADDASCEEMKVENRMINDLPHCRYIELEQNLGIGRIKNYLANEAKYPYLLIMDADTLPCSDHFLAKYLENKHCKAVFCGGLCFKDKAPAPNQTLRYEYGRKVETKSASDRDKAPFHRIISINFFLSKELFNQVRFDETITSYGHEDTLFAIDLKKKRIPLINLNNPVYHEVEDTNERFLEKTKQGIQNLANHYELFKGHVRLLATYDQVKDIRLDKILGFCFKYGSKLMEQNLCGRHPILKLFAFYKLTYMCHITSDLRQNKHLET